ncbi:MAG: hypothetical protein IJV73_00850 [Clostridia bacterium]|nr:hypothetical protein [Clostridia bacterium]
MAKTKEPAIMEGGNAYILQAGTPIFVKTADICSMIGKSNQWVGQLTSQGTLNKSMTPHGSLYNLTDNIRSYCDMLEERASANPVDEEEDKIEKAKRMADARIKASKAVIADLQAKEMQGKMHRSEDVSAMTEDLIYAIRGALIALPGRLSVEVAAISDPAEVSAVIQREVYKIMEDLSTYQYDPKKYEERVRARMNMEPITNGDDEED